ncbi:solute carrier family 2, facilitated glucose transporter member 10 [Hemibagrus wyckioides]|uniref:solute carrier family 2, facilitated glucose transporter member 10 n=1 Tax=Hemibagrus wyckioides TaxID=337641 RepID=UPI00266DBEFF|nr:solute carrier family 2, facilitated glucose transporter member 10 [Hemibagrus wyckioides]XP_058228867.1 solute carrier family 2, facilitated glucose transporter member 10 [Hemibagrus wyckioides]
MGYSVIVVAAAVSTLGGLVFGYELGIISGALLQLQVQFQLSCVQQEAVVSSLLIGAILASVLGGWLIDRRGRRMSILLSNFLIVGGSLILSLSISFPMLISGRLMVGFAMCVSSMSCCIFVSELVSPEHRGLMVTLYEVGVTVGILLAYAVNYVLSGAQGGWRYMFGLVVAPSLGQLVLLWVLPSQQTPSSQLLDEDEAFTGAQTRRETNALVILFQQRDNMRTRTTIGLGLVLFQQFTGQPNVLLYASTVFQSVGFESDASAVLASLGLGIIKVVATLAAMLCADKVGRRLLLMGGCSVMAVGLMIIALLSRYSEFDAGRHCSSHLNDTLLPLIRNDTASAGHLDTTELHHTGQSNWMILSCMMAVVAAFSISFGPMTWVVLSEIFPADVRGRAFAFSSCFNWTANLMVTFSFLSVIDLIGLSGTFLVYGVLAVAGVVFIFLLLPETKGKALQDIDRELSERRFPDRAEFCTLFQRRRFSPRYQRVSWTSSSL